MLVKDVMTSPAITVDATAELSDVVPFMLEKRLSGVPVIDDVGRLVGVLSEGDLLRRIEIGTHSVKDRWWLRLFATHTPAEIYRRTHGRKVSDVMTHTPITIEAHDTLADAARLMQNMKIKRLPVLQDNALVGILSRADFMKALSRCLAPAHKKPDMLDAEIRDTIISEINQQPWAADCAISVDSHGGQVTITGVTPTDDQRLAILVAAEGIVGVRQVSDRIGVMDHALSVRI